MPETGVPNIIPNIQLPNFTLPPPNSSTGTSSQGVAMATPELEELIASIVTKVTGPIIQSIINPHANFYKGIEQSIDVQYSGNLTDLDKVPDVVRTLRDFSGNPGEYSSWRKSVERILNIYNHLKGTPKYFGILNTIRNKIIGNADAVLESYNTPLNWECISKCLTTHYADKRDLGTLEYQMTTLTQGNNSVEEYYQMVYKHLSLILNKISSMNITTDAMHLLTETYRDKALDTFIRGLRGDLPRLLGIREPADLPQALYLCQKLENQSFRSQHANIPTGHNKKTIPDLQPRKPTHTPQQQQFFPQLAHIPQHPQQRSHYPNYPQYTQNPQHNPFQQRQYVPPRPTAPKPLTRPEPMDIDHSIRSKGINYMNKPNPHNPLFGKRPSNQNVFSPSMQIHPNKMQRNFHLSTTQDFHNPYLESSTVTEPYEQYEQNIPIADNTTPQGNDAYNSLINSMDHVDIKQGSLNDYISNYNSSAEQLNDYSDIHFLD